MLKHRPQIHHNCTGERLLRAGANPFSGHGFYSPFGAWLWPSFWPFGGGGIPDATATDGEAPPSEGVETDTAAGMQLYGADYANQAAIVMFGGGYTGVVREVPVSEAMWHPERGRLRHRTTTPIQESYES